MNRIKIFLLFTCLSAGMASRSQNSVCDISKITKADKRLIEEFWKDFRRTINTKNKTSLARLIKFPFSCDYCMINGTGTDVKITQKQFDETQHNIFFDPILLGTANKYSKLLDLLFISHNTGQICNLIFGYTAVESSKDSEGMQHFFTIRKIHGRFVLTSAWTVP